MITSNTPDLQTHITFPSKIETGCVQRINCGWRDDHRYIPGRSRRERRDKVVAETSGPPTVLPRIVEKKPASALHFVRPPQHHYHRKQLVQHGLYLAWPLCLWERQPIKLRRAPKNDRNVNPKWKARENTHRVLNNGGQLESARTLSAVLRPAGDAVVWKFHCCAIIEGGNSGGTYPQRNLSILYVCGMVGGVRDRIHNIQRNRE